MKMEQTILTDQDGRLLYLGAGVLPYVDRQMYLRVGYPPGQVEKGDLYLLLRKETVGWQLSVGAAFLAEVQPIIKTISQDTPESFTVLDTVFCGHELQVQVTGYHAEITVGGQTVGCFLAVAEEAQLVLADEKGIYYYHQCQVADWQPGAQSPEAILQGEAFAGRLVQAGLKEQHLWMSQVFSPDLQTVAERQQALLCETVLPLPENGQKWTAYTLWDLAAVTAEYWHLGEIYNHLGNQKSRRPESVATTFRLWGRDEKILKVAQLLQKASRANSTILLTGESGTGKTFLAREIHKNSRREDRLFVHVNCASIPYNLIESELFGYEEGAFTGAVRGGRAGLFEKANGGTLFLDEITELPLSLQGRLLEVLQSKTFFKVGGSEKISVDVRLIAATNRDLKALVREGRFREDLFYRIHVFPVELPPLRERQDDIFTLVMAILPDICHRAEIEPLKIHPEAMAKLQQYSWPGNIRELENILEKAAILSDGQMILATDVQLPEEPLTADRMAVNSSLREQKEAFEAAVIRRTLKECGGERNKTAARLGIGRTSLFEKMRKHGIDLNEETGEDI